MDSATKAVADYAKLTRKAAHSDAEVVRFSVRVVKIDEDKQLVIGEVYAPLIIDSHGDMMEPEDVEVLAHKFMALGLNDHVDVMHNNKPARAVVVESYIARGHPDFTEGAWVAATKIMDTALWADVKVGKYNGYSMEALVRKVPALVTLEIQKQAYGFVEENDGHTHAFFVEVDEDGRVVGGHTSVDKGHSHQIEYGTATATAEGHKHRYFLP